LISKIILLLSLSLLIGASGIDKKISAKKKELHAIKIEYNKMDKKLSTIAKKIIDAKAERKKLERELKKLEKHISDNQSEFDSLKEKKNELDHEVKNLNKKILLKRDKFVALVAEKFSMALVLEEIKQPTPESVMLQEAYGVYAKKNEEEIALLKKEILELKTKEKNFIEKQRSIQKLLLDYKKERDEYRRKKTKKNTLIKHLARDKAIYKKRFDKIRAGQRALRKKLAKLKIIKEDQTRERKERLEAKKEQSGVEEIPNTTKKRSYFAQKTISPLKGSRLIKKFGTYIDPIYKFKIFNKSITLKASYKGAKVKSVLKGKIVFAENSGGMLGKVVIIEHAKNIHTIYAKLSRLAPGIHVGKRVAKGSVIGKVDKSLMFEVTKENKHINPLNLIQL